MEINKYGYIWQNGNRWYIKVGSSTNRSSGFKSKAQFEEWIKGEFRTRGLDWRAGYAWKYKDSNDIYELVSWGGTSPKP